MLYWKVKQSTSSFSPIIAFSFQSSHFQLLQAFFYYLYIPVVIFFIDCLQKEDLDGFPLAKEADIDGHPMVKDDLDGIPIKGDSLDGFPLSKASDVDIDGIPLGSDNGWSQSEFICLFVNEKSGGNFF